MNNKIEGNCLITDNDGNTYSAEASDWNGELIEYTEMLVQPLEGATNDDAFIERAMKMYGQQWSDFNKEINTLIDNIRWNEIRVSGKQPQEPLLEFVNDLQELINPANKGVNI